MTKILVMRRDRDFLASIEGDPAIDATGTRREEAIVALLRANVALFGITIETVDAPVDPEWQARFAAALARVVDGEYGAVYGPTRLGPLLRTLPAEMVLEDCHQRPIDREDRIARDADWQVIVRRSGEPGGPRPLLICIGEQPIFTERPSAKTPGWTDTTGEG